MSWKFVVAVVITVPLSGGCSGESVVAGESVFDPGRPIRRLEGFRRAPDEIVEVQVLGETVEASRYGGEYFIEGDMQVFPDDEGNRKGVARRGSRNGDSFQWTNGVVNYRLGDFQTSGTATDSNDQPVDTTPETQATYYQSIRDAIADWEAAVPGLRFVEVGAGFSGDLVLFERDEGNACHSSVGRQGGTQRVHLSDWCFFFRDGAGTIIQRRFSVHHEIGHALGLRHEHQRSDRNNFVSVTGTGGNFDVDTTNYRDIGDYDCESVMHYPTSRSLTSLVDTEGVAACPELGQRDRLSEGDVASMRVLYPVIHVQRSGFADSGLLQLCALSGRREDGNTWFDVETPSSVLAQGFDDGGRLDTSVGTGDYEVLNCSADSRFWISDYDYPASVRTLTRPVAPLETYVASGTPTLRLMDLGLIAALF